MRNAQDSGAVGGPAEAIGDRAFAPTLLTTAAWYAGVMLLFFAWTLFADGDCAGQPCGRGARISEGLSAALPWGVPALALSLLIAVLLRIPVVGWRSGATGTAAALLGAGLTTVILRTVGYHIG